MPKPIKSHVQRIFARNGRGHKLWTAIHDGWASRKDHPRAGQWRRKTTRAHVVWEDIIAKTVELVDDDPGVKIISHHDTVSFIFDDSVLLRFKKADIALRTSNVSTELADLFDDHTMDLFGHRGLQRVEVVYVLNKFETEIIWTGVVATDCGSYLWDLELAPLTADMPIPFPSTQPQHGDTADLAKLKRQEAEVIEFKKKEDDGEE